MTMVSVTLTEQFGWSGREHLSEGMGEELEPVSVNSSFVELAIMETESGL